MATAIIEVSLADDQADGAMRSFHPGETIRGTVQVTPETELTCKHLHIRLAWHTEGQGTRDSQSVAQIDVFQGTLPPRIPNHYDFAFALPNAPWSYAGHYINIVWEIEVDIDVPWATNPKQSYPFILTPAHY